MKKNTVKFELNDNREWDKIEKLVELSDGSILPVNGAGTKNRIAHIANTNTSDFDNVFVKLGLIDTNFIPCRVKDTNNVNKLDFITSTIYKCLVVQQVNVMKVIEFFKNQKRLLAHNSTNNYNIVLANNNNTNILLWVSNLLAMAKSIVGLEDIGASIRHYLKRMGYNETQIDHSIRANGETIRNYDKDIEMITDNFNTWTVRNWIDNRGFIASFETGEASFKEFVQVYQYGEKEYTFQNVMTNDNGHKLCLYTSLRKEIQYLYNEDTRVWNESIKPLLNTVFNNLDTLYGALKKAKSAKSFDFTNTITDKNVILEHINELLEFYKSQIIANNEANASYDDGFIESEEFDLFFKANNNDATDATTDEHEVLVEQEMLNVQDVE